MSCEPSASRRTALFGLALCLLGVLSCFVRAGQLSADDPPASLRKNDDRRLNSIGEKLDSVAGRGFWCVISNGRLLWLDKEFPAQAIARRLCAHAYAWRPDAAYQGAQQVFPLLGEIQMSRRFLEKQGIVFETNPGGDGVVLAFAGRKMTVDHAGVPFTLPVTLRGLWGGEISAKAVLFGLDDGLLVIGQAAEDLGLLFSEVPGKGDFRLCGSGVEVPARHATVSLELSPIGFKSWAVCRYFTENARKVVASCNFELISGGMLRMPGNAGAWAVCSLGEARVLPRLSDAVLAIEESRRTDAFHGLVQLPAEGTRTLWEEDGMRTRVLIQGVPWGGRAWKYGDDQFVILDEGAPSERLRSVGIECYGRTYVQAGARKSAPMVGWVVRGALSASAPERDCFIVLLPREP